MTTFKVIIEEYGGPDFVRIDIWHPHASRMLRTVEGKTEGIALIFEPAVALALGKILTEELSVLLGPGCHYPDHGTHPCGRCPGCCGAEEYCCVIVREQPDIDTETEPIDEQLEGWDCRAGFSP